ncbi:hypothetical protein LCGC14_2704280 [marine sediment metagenome]|uniref:Uncharacterized protein n=1 Tax=marine sediment metagenome TaxID=412755 RepID=A0A0F9A2F2_9ZZZZ
MNDDTRLDCSDYDYHKRPPAKGLLTDINHERARQMLRDISEKKPWYGAMERRMLKGLWSKTRNFTFAENDLIKQIYARIKH